MPNPSTAGNADAAPVDLETRAGDTAHEALRLWLRLLTCTNLVEADIRSRLRQDFACTLPRFDLMSQLDRHPEGLKMGELSRRMMVTGGNVTGITDQLQQEGLVSREALPTDRRAYLIRLTPAGREAFSRMRARMRTGSSNCSRAWPTLTAARCSAFWAGSRPA